METLLCDGAFSSDMAILRFGLEGTLVFNVFCLGLSSACREPSYALRDEGGLSPLLGV